MFLESSRYSGQKTADVALSGGRRAKVLKLRRLPSAKGTSTVVKGSDRMDIMAMRKYGDPTRFWRIADANTELDASRLTEKAGRTIRVPENK